MIKNILKKGEPGLKQDLLIYGKEYDLWKEGEYIGRATYTDDPNIGDCFLKTKINDTNEECFEVHMPDEWEFTN